MTAKLINFIESSSLPTDIATFTVHAFTEINNEKDHLAITIGNISKSNPVLTRIHSQCITGESFFSLRCDCRFQLSESLKRIAEKGTGIVKHFPAMAVRCKYCSVQPICSQAASMLIEGRLDL